MAKSGLLMMLEALGLKIDPAEIQAQIGQFKSLAESIDNRLALIHQQNVAIMAALKRGDGSDGKSGADDKPGNGDGTPGVYGQADRADE